MFKLKNIHLPMLEKDSKEMKQLHPDLEWMGCAGFMVVPWNFSKSNCMVMEIAKEMEVDPRWSKSPRGKTSRVC